MTITITITLKSHINENSDIENNNHIDHIRVTLTIKDSIDQKRHIDKNHHIGKHHHIDNSNHIDSKSHMDNQSHINRSHFNNKCHIDNQRHIDNQCHINQSHIYNKCHIHNNNHIDNRSHIDNNKRYQKLCTASSNTKTKILTLVGHFWEQIVGCIVKDALCNCSKENHASQIEYFVLVTSCVKNKRLLLLKRIHFFNFKTHVNITSILILYFLWTLTNAQYQKEKDTYNNIFALTTFIKIWHSSPYFYKVIKISKT